MKHLLNNLSEEEKNSIREQHEGGMSVDTTKFKKLVENKLGNAKPIINEALNYKKTVDEVVKQFLNKKGTVTVTSNGIMLTLDGINIMLSPSQSAGQPKPAQQTPQPQQQGGTKTLSADDL